MPCTTLLSNSSEWTGYLGGYNKLNGVFSLVASVSNVTEAVRLRGNTTELEFSVVVYSRGSASQSWAVLRNFTSVKTRIYCRRNRNVCDDVVVLSESAVECLRCDTPFTFSRQFKVRVTYPLSSDLFAFGRSLSYAFVYHNDGFRVKEAIVRMVLLAVTMGFLALFMGTMRHWHFAKWLPEQKWIIGLLLSLALYLNPFFVALLYLPDYWTEFFATLCSLTAITVMLVFWLLMMDGLRHSRHPFLRFYLPKLAWGLLTWLGLFGVALGNLLFASRDAQLNRDADHVNRLIKAGSILSSIMYGVWGLWFCYLVVNTHVMLKRLPYLSTRFQQLSFRFFVIQAGMVILFLAFSVIYSLATPNNLHRGMSFSSIGGFYEDDSDRDSSNQNEHSFGALVLISVYTFFVVVVYLPPDRSVLSLLFRRPSKGAYLRMVDEDHRYSVSTSRWLFDFAWHVYYDPPGLPTTESAFGVMDPGEFTFELLEFISNPATDTHCMIALDHGRVVVAFRGSNSKKNWASNTKVRRRGIDDRRHFFLFNLPGVRLLQDTAGPLIHSGFMSAYLPLWDRVRAGVRRALAAASVTDHVYVTGHSLGGAMATLAALDLATQLGLRVTMHNFGSPRVGNYAFAKAYDKVVPDSYRVVSDGDVVTGVPKLLFMYTHIGRECVVDTQGNLIIDPTFVEKTFRTSSRSKLKSHMMNSYRTCLDAVLVAQGISIASKKTATASSAAAASSASASASASSAGMGPITTDPIPVHRRQPSAGLGAFAAIPSPKPPSSLAGGLIFSTNSSNSNNAGTPQLPAAGATADDDNQRSESLGQRPSQRRRSLEPSFAINIKRSEKEVDSEFAEQVGKAMSL